MEVTENPIQVKLLRNVFKGQNTRGSYYLYVVQGPDGREYSWFAPIEAHDVIQNASLKVGSEIMVSRGTNGKQGKIEVAILGTSHVESSQKDLMRQCLKDALEITKEIEGVPWRSEDIQRISVAMFISCSRQSQNA